MSTTVVVAREFRGSRLFLTSSKPREFTWSANRELAMKLSTAVAVRILRECEDFQRGTDAFAIDKDDCIIAHVSNGAILPRRDGEAHLNLGDDLRVGQCAYILDQVACENLASPGDIYCEDCQSAVERNAQTARE